MSLCNLYIHYITLWFMKERGGRGFIGDACGDVIPLYMMQCYSDGDGGDGVMVRM